MELRKWSPWNWFKHEPESNSLMTQNYYPVNRLHTEIDRMFDDFMRGSSLFPSVGESGSLLDKVGLLKPKLDISENAENYCISVEVPGIDEKDIQLQLNGDVLTIRGEKRQKHENKDDKYHRVERTYGSFQRVLTLPKDADTGTINAKFDNGVLNITVARSGKHEENSRRIEIQKK
jgi:HSP20 family protein